jgi:hypothetical protein
VGGISSYFNQEMSKKESGKLIVPSFRTFECMGNKAASILFGFFVFCSVASAQMLKLVPISYLNENRHVQQNGFNMTATMGKSVTLLDNPRFIMSDNLKCTLPKGAIFCRMEDAIYNHLNFWVKFRMGTDDRYSN